jgi:hypothetical protein
MRAITRLVHRIPFTLLMLAGLAVGALVTNTFVQSITQHWLNRAGFAPNDLWYWRLERVFTSTLVTIGGRVFWEAMAMVALIVGMTEWRNGWKRTALTFWGVNLLTLMLLSLIISLMNHQLRNFGMEADVMARDVGPSAGYFACLGLLSAQLKPPWHWISGGIILAGFVITLFMPATAGQDAQLKFSADLAHLLAFPLGWFSIRLRPRQA